ncbi:MAG: glycosyltransferase family 4 protein [Candidatus Nanohaloarchaea archaeon]
MKALVLNPRFSPPLGGATGVAVTIAEALLEKGHDVTYVTGADQSQSTLQSRYDLDLEGLKIETHRPPLSFRLVERSGRFTILRRSLEDRSFLNLTKRREDEFDLIVLGRHVFHADVSFETPVIQYVHDYLRGDGLDKPAPYEALYSRVGRPIIFQNADRNFFNSRYIQDMNREEGEVLYPPVDSAFDPSRSGGDREDTAVIVGRLAPDKNFKEAIDIVSRTDLTLHIIGSEQDERYVEELSERVAATGGELRTDVPRPELRRLLETAKIGLSCKREENFGINVVEYMKAGLLPMVYDHAGPAEIVRDDRFRYTQVDEAVRKIEQNLEDFSSLQDEALERADDFGEEQFRGRLVSMAQELVEN